MSSVQIKAKINSNTRISQHCYKLSLAVGAVAKKASPGNFLMVRVSSGVEPLLRRPLSIHRVNAAQGVVELLYEVVGSGTQALSQKKAYEHVSVIGPLGNSFVLNSKAEETPVILVAGGMGVAPLMFLAQRLQVGKVTALIGARTSEHILCACDFKKLGIVVRIATDDGSCGFHGRVTGLLENIIADKKQQGAMLYGCGPKPMLKAMSGLCSSHGLTAQISLEAHMACGIGACLGCAVQTKQGFRRVCKEGPVFWADELVW